jgi:hypothetical protein
MNQVIETNATDINFQTAEAVAQSFNSTQGVTMQVTNIQYTSNQVAPTIKDVKNLNQQMLSQESGFNQLKTTAQQNLCAILGKVFDLCSEPYNNEGSALRYAYKIKFQATKKGKLNSKRDFKFGNDMFLKEFFTDVFAGLSAKKAYTYRTVIKYALKQNIKAGRFVSFVNEKGGLENTRLAKYAADREASGQETPETRKQNTSNFSKTKNIAVIESSEFSVSLSNYEANEQFMLLATKLDTGEIAINGIVSNEFAMTVALRTFYNDNKSSVEEFAKRNVSASASADQASQDEDSSDIPEESLEFDASELTAVTA